MTEAAVKTTTSPTATATAERILVVDDDATARLLMRAALRKAGYEVTLAQGGKEALRQFEAETFDMVMLDVDMPDMNGYEVCAALRLQSAALLPVLMVTGMDDVASVEAAFNAGATDFISKPLNWALIGHRVKYLLKSRDNQRELAAANVRTNAILDAIPDLLFEVDADGRYLSFHSPKTCLLAAPIGVFLGKTILEVMPAMVAHVCMDAVNEAQLNGASKGKQFELVLNHKTYWFELSVARKEADSKTGSNASFIVLSRDITERKTADEKIKQLAFFDSLTGLANRHAFLERVERELRRARHKGSRFGVLFMDLDGFKQINDTLGHGVGDKALQWCADSLREAVRAADVVARAVGSTTSIELARLGGDEFTALILDIHRPEDALQVANRILELMRHPFMVGEQQLRLTSSIGIAFYPEDGDSAHSLLKHADTAMYLAKDMGRNQCQFYSADLTQKAVQRMALETDLRQALERQEFVLHYQPQIDATTGHICGAEALIRWHRPGLGLVLPLAFIAAAEQCGLIIPIGQWVLHTACVQAALWHRAGWPLRVAVNLSAVQFSDPQLHACVLGSLAQTGLPPDCLELEVTESTLMADTEATVTMLNSLRDTAVHLALDDFGTGYSSLSCLKRLPLNQLKIDQVFVNGLPDNAEDMAIARAILSMAKSLHLRVTAEGVETPAQAQVLTTMGCNMLQGNHFGHPMPAQQMTELLARQSPAGT